MSTIGSTTSGSSAYRGAQGTFKAWWANNVRDVAYGVLYAMVKENNFNRIFVIVSIVIEFFQMIFFCFSSDFHWGGINLDIKVTTIFVNYQGFSIVFWIVISLLVLAMANVAYIGYTFHQGEIKSIILLRTLRWICSLFVSVLFIPILYVLLGPLTCDYANNPATLMDYKTVQCWGSQNMVVAVIAVVLLIIFSGFSLLVGLTYYEYDPNMIKTYSRLQNRFEFGSLLIKIVIVFVSLFLHSHPIVYAVISLFTSFCLVVGYIVMVPAYDRKINLMRAGSYAGIFWVNVGMILALIINDRHNYTSTIVAAVGCPWLIALGCFVTDKRIKYLCNPRLVDGFVSSESSLKDSPARKPLKKGVKWEQPRSSNNLIKNALYSRLRFPTDVEIAARFVLQEKPNATLIEKAKSVYHTGLCKFPNSPTVMMAYTNFIFTTAGDWQLGYVTLEKLRKMDPFLDISFFVYRYDKDREQRIEGGTNKIGDFVDFMEYKKLMRAAKQYHHMALVCIRRFWKHLLDKKIDVMQLSTLSSKIAFAEKKATEAYIKLITRYPKNIRVLRDYARFLDEVASDEKAAHEFWRKADKYEEREMEKLTESHRSQGIEHGETPMGDDEPEENVAHNDNGSMSDKSSHTSGDSGDYGSVSSKSSGVRSGLELAKQDKNQNLKKLGWIMFFTTLFAMVVMFTQLGVLNTQLNNYTNVILALDGAGGVSHTGVLVASEAMDIYLFNLLCTEGIWNESSVVYFLSDTMTFPMLTKKVTSNLNLFINNVKSLYWGESDSYSFTTNRRRSLRKQAGMKLKFDPTSHSMDYHEFDHKTFAKKEVVAYFNQVMWNETVISSNDDNNLLRETNLIDFWTFCFLTYSYGVDVGTWSYDQILTLSEDETFDITFVTDNVESLASASRGLMDFYAKNISDQVHLLRIICIVIFGCAVLLLLLASLVFFMPVVNSIFQYKIKTFHVFTLIPTSVVKHMARRKISSLGTEASDCEEEEANYNNNVPRMRMTRSSSDTKFGTWKDDKEKTEVESDHDEPVKEMVEMRSTQGFTNLLHAPSHVTPHAGVRKSPFSDDEENSDLITPGMPSPGRPNTTLQPSQSVTIQVSSAEPDLQGPSGKSDSDSENEEVQPDGRFSTIQKIKNKLWLKVPTNKFTKLVQEEDKEEKKDEHDKDTPSGHKKEARKSRMNTASMNQVTRKLHFSYVFAIMCFIAAMLVSFVTLLTEFQNLTNLAVNLKKSDIRTQYCHLLLYDVQVLTMYGVNDSVALTAVQNIPLHIDTVYDLHKSIHPPDYQMDWLYGTECFRINQTKCPPPDYEYIDFINKGVEFTFNAYLTMASDLLGGYLRDGKLSPLDPQYARFRSIAENDMMDGLERLTFLFQQNAMQQISSAKLRVGVITGVVCVAFVFIHIVLFKPFVRKLREESEHTFSIVRMIPRKLIGDIPEIQAFLQESTEGVDRDDY